MLLALSGVVLASCSTVDEIVGSEQVDYKSTVRGDPLNLPPDLSKAQINPQYTNSSGQASANRYNQEVDRANANRDGVDQVLPQNEEIRVMRNGSDRWLIINQNPKQVYDSLIAFWGTEGFTIKEDNPAAGIIQTDWAENRANIPGNFLRRVVGSVIDIVADSGQRERYTTRLERNNGKTEVHISHERMIETAMDRDGDTFKWLPAKEDPGLNAVMLARFMQYVGVNKDNAEDQIRKAQALSQPTATVSTSSAITVNGNQLSSNLGFDQTWTRVGQALNQAGFTIESHNKANGVYSVLYLDTDNGVKRKAGNAIGRIWGKEGNLNPEKYKIRIKSQGDQTVITADNRQKQDQQSAQATANRILRVIAERF